MPGEVKTLEADWAVVVSDLATRGWARLRGAVPSDISSALEEAAPGPWVPVPETEGDAGVRQAGLACHSNIDGAAEVVRRLAGSIVEGIKNQVVAQAMQPLPVFNHAQWSRADAGRKYITRHRDPPSAGGVIAVVTIRGRALFRVWEESRAQEWETADGDVVLLRGGGWPTADARCPIHEVESPKVGDRLTLTLRHNKSGFGADYFD